MRIEQPRQFYNSSCDMILRGYDYNHNPPAQFQFRQVVDPILTISPTTACHNPFNLPRPNMYVTTPHPVHDFVDLRWMENGNI